MQVGAIEWADDGLADLQRISDPAVQAEIVDIAEREIKLPPGQSEIEGRLVDHPSVYWRRALRVADVSKFLSFDLEDEDEFQEQAANYVLVYRRMTVDERIRFRRRVGKPIVVRVLHNREFARIIDPQALPQGGQWEFRAPTFQPSRSRWNFVLSATRLFFGARGRKSRRGQA